jgi:ComF family protein
MSINICGYAKYLLSLLGRTITIPFCAYCRVLLADDKALCVECSARITPIVSTTVEVTPSKTMKVIAISNYVDPIKFFILAKGHSNIAAACQLGQLVWQHTSFKHMPCDVLVPVPLHWMRYASRGYNQAEEMARVLGSYAQKPVSTLVRRTHHTQFQSRIPFGSRQENVQDAFILCVKDPKIYQGKHIVIVDDLMTSGATLRMVAKELLKLRPASLAAVVAARVV